LDSFGEFSRTKIRQILEIPEVLRGLIRKLPDKKWRKLKTLGGTPPWDIWERNMS
jgi:hypothetical protein